MNYVAVFVKVLYNKKVEKKAKNKTRRNQNACTYSTRTNEQARTLAIPPRPLRLNFLNSLITWGCRLMVRTRVFLTRNAGSIPVSPS